MTASRWAIQAARDTNYLGETYRKGEFLRTPRGRTRTWEMYLHARRWMKANVQGNYENAGWRISRLEKKTR